MALERVKQTSRTILVEEFNPQCVNLSTLIKVEDIHKKSEFCEKVRNSLEVNTFEEFMDKFMPKIYEYTVQSNDPDVPFSFEYSVEPPQNVTAHEVEISKQAFFRMVMNIYEDRAESGLSNTKTETFKRIGELLSPQSALEQAKKTRSQLQYVAMQLDKLKGTPGVEQKQYKMKMKEIRKEIIKTYNESVIGLLPLALADTQEKLNVVALPDNQINNKEQQIAALPCEICFDDEGALQVIPVDNISDNNKIAERKDNNIMTIDVAERLKKDFEQHSNKNANSEFLLNLVIESYTGYSIKEEMVEEFHKLDIDKLKKQKDVYTKIYKKSQEQFIEAISEIVEKILDVKVFFDHATRNGKALPAPLIVTNCKAYDLLENGVKENFTYYIEEMGKETGGNAIWFGIIPGVRDSDFVDISQDDNYNDNYDDEYNDIMDEELYDDKKDDDKKNEKLVTLDSCKALIEILRKGKIATFFNFKANEKTGFENFTGSVLKQYKEKVESLTGNKYAVFTYPNFTLIPKKETCIEIGTVTINGEDKSERLELPGVYVESAYVAAGMVVGSQDPYLLKDKGFKINPNNPGVRFDFEEGDNNKIVLSRMAREGDTIWDSQAEEILLEDMFGFCFCGNSMYYKNMPIKNSYVYTARTMEKDVKNGKYKSLYKTLTEKYIILYLSATNGGSSAKKSIVNTFIKNTVRTWIHEADSNESKDIINNILRNGEKIEFSPEDKKIHILFNEDDELVDLDVVED